MTSATVRAVAVRIDASKTVSSSGWRRGPLREDLRELARTMRGRLDDPVRPWNAGDRFAEWIVETSLVAERYEAIWDWTERMRNEGYVGLEWTTRILDEMPVLSVQKIIYETRSCAFAHGHLQVIRHKAGEARLVDPNSDWNTPSHYRIDMQTTFCSWNCTYAAKSEFDEIADGTTERIRSVAATWGINPPHEFATTISTRRLDETGNTLFLQVR